MSAIDSCLTFATFWRSRPTRLRHPDEDRNERQREQRRAASSRMNMATTLAITVVTFATIEVAVDVTTSCTPPMSFARRDCTSPVRVLVKKASDSRCRCL